MKKETKEATPTFISHKRKHRKGRTYGGTNHSVQVSSENHPTGSTQKRRREKLSNWQGNKQEEYEKRIVWGEDLN